MVDMRAVYQVAVSTTTVAMSCVALTIANAPETAGEQAVLEAGLTQERRRKQLQHQHQP